ncbi:MAG: SAM-dependent methyltransferase [Clostridia bacterium]|nr:SAM-dependent methyltransferase [Clostridia bacterium]
MGEKQNVCETDARMAELIACAAEAGALKKAVLSKPHDEATVRTTLTLRRVGARTVVQAETLRADHKALHENIELADRERFASLCGAFSQVNLITTVGTCELRRSKSGKVTLLGGEKLLRALGAGVAPQAPIAGNNREKSYILRGDEPFLKLLDVSDENGRVRDKRQSKFRQINRFLELIRDCLDALPTTGTLRICDLCCGKSYLSFAAYHYFANVLGRDVRMSGVDLKPDVIAYCNDVAQKLGFDGLEFFCGDVKKYEVGEHVHLVISLHACDIATDFVLDKALEWGADVILSTPCCHHEMNHTIRCEALSFITEHSMLRQKLCDAATDALRLKRLEANGYAVSALELIDPEETPKNIMLRARRLPQIDPASPACRAAMEEYRAAKAFLVGDAEVSF